VTRIYHIVSSRDEGVSTEIKLGNSFVLRNPWNDAGPLKRVMTAVLKDDTELFKQFMDNDGFRRRMTDTVFGLTYEASGAGGPTSR
jgi:hypothetical protein